MHYINASATAFVNFLIKKKTRKALQLPDTLIIFRKGERILLQVEKKDIYSDDVRLGRRLSFGETVNYFVSVRQDSLCYT